MSITGLSSTSTATAGTQDDDSAVTILPTTGTISIDPTAIDISLSLIKNALQWTVLLRLLVE